MYIPQFYYIKVGFKGVFIPRTCFPDELDDTRCPYKVIFILMRNLEHE